MTFLFKFARFTCKVGDAVSADQNVMEIETDKTTVGVPTPVNGVIEEIYVKDGDTVKAGQELFKLKPGGGGAAPAAAKPAAAAAPAPTPAPAAAAPKPAAPAAAAPPPPPPAARAAPPPPPPKPAAPSSTVPIAAIRHAQAQEASVKVSWDSYNWFKGKNDLLHYTTIFEIVDFAKLIIFDIV